MEQMTSDEYPLIQKNERQMDIEKFRSFAEMYHVPIEICQMLRGIENYQLSCILDNSSSMENCIKNKDPFKPSKRRWELAHETFHIIADIAGLLSENGIDVYPLNGYAPILGVKNSSQIDSLFATKPLGITQLNKAYESIIYQHRSMLGERKLHTFIITDGEPTDDNGQSDKETFKRTIANRSPIDNLTISFLVCTDEKESVDYLDEWMEDKNMKIDVTEFYENELEEMKIKHGQDFKFSLGEYVIKALLGGICPQIRDYYESDYKSPSEFLLSNNSTTIQSVPQNKTQSPTNNVCCSDCCIIL